MATGDLKNNLRILNNELKKINVPSSICNMSGLSSGDTDTFLDIFDSILLWNCPALSRLINSKGLKPPSKEANKTKFLEGVYLIFREIFNWKPPLTVTQFMSTGFHERKVIMCSEFIKLASSKIQELEPKVVKKHQMASGHCGLKLILKQPKNVKGIVHPLSEKDANMTSSEESHFTERGILKGEPYLHSDVSEKSVCSASAPSKSFCTTSTHKENKDPEVAKTSSEKIFKDLVEFKAVVFKKLESIESHLSAVEKRIGTVEIVINSLNSVNNITNVVSLEKQ